MLHAVQRTKMVPSPKTLLLQHSETCHESALMDRILGFKIVTLLSQISKVVIYLNTLMLLFGLCPLSQAVSVKIQSNVELWRNNSCESKEETFLLIGMGTICGIAR